MCTHVKKSCLRFGQSASFALEETTKKKFCGLHTKTSGGVDLQLLNGLPTWWTSYQAIRLVCFRQGLRWMSGKDGQTSYLPHRSHHLSEVEEDV